MPIYETGFEITSSCTHIIHGYFFINQNTIVNNSTVQQPFQARAWHLTADLFSAYQQIGK